MLPCPLGVSQLNNQPAMSCLPVSMQFSTSLPKKTKMYAQQGAEAPISCELSVCSISFKETSYNLGQIFKSSIYPQIIFSARNHLSLYAHICVAGFLSMIANTKPYTGL